MEADLKRIDRRSSFCGMLNKLESLDSPSLLTFALEYFKEASLLNNSIKFSRNSATQTELPSHLNCCCAVADKTGPTAIGCGEEWSCLTVEKKSVFEESNKDQ
ncbi:unnamed protein product [Brugia pahangi]|uniref:RIIa domain-containing protein n=1 Tax=Brugia pahangi TaxID=6280 RepID=A0A0N4TLH2_BRUPA|nr:unnamed protein product [Brugia pahangi]